MSGEWWRTEAALSRVLPPRLAGAVLAAPRGASVIVRWVLRRRPSGTAFPHHRDMTVLAWFLVAMTVLEGAVLDVVLRAILGPSPWVWLALVAHLLGVYLLIAAYAGMVTRPHTLDGGILRLRTGLGTEVAIALSSVEDATAGRYPGFDQSAWRVDDSGDATLARGDANLRLSLTCGSTVMVNACPWPAPRTVHVTVDEPRLMARAIAEAQQLATA